LLAGTIEFGVPVRYSSENLKTAIVFCGASAGIFERIFVGTASKKRNRGWTNRRVAKLALIKNSYREEIWMEEEESW
jgi:hypothetical protein